LIQDETWNGLVAGRIGKDGGTTTYMDN